MGERAPFGQVWWLSGGVLVATFTMNGPDEEHEAAPKWIEVTHRVAAGTLADALGPLSE